MEYNVRYDREVDDRLSFTIERSTIERYWITIVVSRGYFVDTTVTATHSEVKCPAYAKQTGLSSSPTFSRRQKETATSHGLIARCTV
jgi:hypothetical protein